MIFHNGNKPCKQFAALDNVYVKLSGFYESADTLLSAPQCQPFIDTLLNCFTTDKMMWGSNWPVLTLWGSYHAWLQTCQQCLSILTEKQYTNIFQFNALSFYHC